jgi:hypothetical protein
VFLERESIMKFTDYIFDAIVYKAREINPAVTVGERQVIGTRDEVEYIVWNPETGVSGQIKVTALEEFQGLSHLGGILDEQIKNLPEGVMQMITNGEVDKEIDEAFSKYKTLKEATDKVKELGRELIGALKERDQAIDTLDIVLQYGNKDCTAMAEKALGYDPRSILIQKD